MTWFGVHPQVIAALVDGNRDISVKSALDHAPDTIQHFVNTDWLYLLPLRAGKAQKLARQIGCALGELLNHSHGVLQRVIGTQPMPRQ